MASKFDLNFSLPSVFLTLGKQGLCRVSKENTQQRLLCWMSKKTLGKEFFKFKKFKYSFCMTR